MWSHRAMAAFNFYKFFTKILRIVNFFHVSIFLRAQKPNSLNYRYRIKFVFQLFFVNLFTNLNELFISMCIFTLNE